jgi:hypothetical protein
MTRNGTAMLHQPNEREGGESPQPVDIDGFKVLSEAAVKANWSVQEFRQVVAELQQRFAAEGEDRWAEDQNANQGN